MAATTPTSTTPNKGVREQLLNLAPQFQAFCKNQEIPLEMTMKKANELFDNYLFSGTCFFSGARAPLSSILGFSLGYIGTALTYKRFSSKESRPTNPTVLEKMSDQLKQSRILKVGFVALFLLVQYIIDISGATTGFFSGLCLGNHVFYHVKRAEIDAGKKSE